VGFLGVLRGGGRFFEKGGFLVVFWGVWKKAVKWGVVGGGLILARNEVCFGGISFNAEIGRFCVVSG